MIEIPALPNAIENMQALMMYNLILQWLCGVVIAIVIALVYDREKRIKKGEEKFEREIEILKEQLRNEKRYKNEN